MRDVIVREILIPSLIELYKVDYDNIRFGVSERNICARLAHHMENLMRRYDEVNGTDSFLNYFADVEYNRMGNGDQKHYENSEHRPVYMVSDLLIQTRGYGRNYLAVEIKRKGNNRNVDEDKKRLMSLVSSPSDYQNAQTCVYDTLVGAFIVFSCTDVVLELFENNDGSGAKTAEIHFQYDGETEALIIK